MDRKHSHPTPPNKINITYTVTQPQGYLLAEILVTLAVIALFSSAVFRLGQLPNILIKQAQFSTTYQNAYLAKLMSVCYKQNVQIQRTDTQLITHTEQHDIIRTPLFDRYLPDFNFKGYWAFNSIGNTTAPGTIRIREHPRTLTLSIGHSKINQH